MAKLTAEERKEIEGKIEEGKKEMSSECKSISEQSSQLLQSLVAGVRAGYIKKGDAGWQETTESLRALIKKCEKTATQFVDIQMYDESKECAAQKEVYLKMLQVLTDGAIPA